MRCVVTFVFGSEQVVKVPVSVVGSDIAARQAREWFEDAWVRFGCEPVRDSGKVLLLDRIMCVTEALGYAVLAEDAAQAQQLATQAALVLNRPTITVDLVEKMVSF